ncbi:ABC transporter permease [Infirmifilum sp. NZ]|nr:ABC transporter permease [Infirmifilum sp. NZ]UNQ73330.1 ABC transporter permease [Infirmifilum sp. NZ]
MPGIRKYLLSKVTIYAVTFFVAVTLDWAIPRFMPGDPIAILISRMSTLPQSAQVLYSYFYHAFGLNEPLWKQYLNFWAALLQGDLGVSIYLYPRRVADIIFSALPYDIILLYPAVISSWIVGNLLGALAARSRFLDSVTLPVFYFLNASPYFWLAIVLQWNFTVTLPVFPPSGAYTPGHIPSLTLDFVVDFLYHYILPFLSIFLVSLGGWAIGMRNMIIYEIESDYIRYLESLGVPRSLQLNYAFKNSILPQITGLALQMGTVVTGAITTEVVFSYPGLGYILMQGILNEDYFLIQGCFLFIVLLVLASNFVIDLLYAVIDPRIRVATVGE